MSLDDDDMETTQVTGTLVALDPTRELKVVLEDLEALLKNGDVIGALSGKGINASIALLGVQGLMAYLDGEKAAAAEDFGTASEEIRGRLVAHEPPEKSS